MPYTYTDLIEYLRQFKENPHPSLKIEALCKTVTGIKVPLLTVTDFSIPNNKKQVIFINARVHPGEPQSSWLMEGIIDLLLKAPADDNEKIERSKLLKEKFIFKLIPMMNIEGVIFGNTRTSL